MVMVQKFSSRHNRICDIIFELASNAHLVPVKEKPNIFTDQRRPADVFVPQLFGGRPAALDVAVTCPLQKKYANLDQYTSHVEKNLNLIEMSSI